jgi:NitT/TauT family transport system substrate-binding protein
MQRRFLFILLAVAMLLSACGGVETQAVTIRIAVLPVLDTLPLYVAESQGFFAEHNLQVEFVPVASAPERDQLMQAGQVDAMLNEVVSTLFYNAEQPRITIVRFARVATEEYPLFRILAAPGSGIQQVADLKGVPIGISDGTVIEYTTDRLLEHAGFSPQDIAYQSVPKIPDRLALLGSGQLLAANLPDPVASLALLNGASVVLDDTSYPEISHSVYSFSRTFLEQNPQAVRVFLAAVEEAVTAINADKTRWDELLIARALLPEALIGSYTLPDFPTASVPSLAQFNDAHEWAKAKGYISLPMQYADSVDASFLP